MDESSDAIYENVRMRNLEPNRTRPACSGNEHIHTDARDERKNFCRGAAVFLCLLCLLLLAGLLVLVFLFTKGNSERKIEMGRLQSNYNNMTRERNDLQTSYNNLTKDLEQIQTNNNNLTKDLEQIQTRYRNLAEEHDQLQKRFEDMTKERDDVQKKIQDYKKWVYFGGSLYYISSNTNTWKKSRDDCLQRNADLLIINSKEELDFARLFKRRLWIGLTDSGTERTWKWVDGSRLTTSYWSSGEPNGSPPGRDEDCAEIKSFENENCWNDEICNNLSSWICEKTAAL
ncbi:CD209 antigen-like protein 2 [Scomber scombrus]